MVDGIDKARGHDEATKLVLAAQDRFVAGEDPVVTAARRVVRDHERDPSDGTMRTFGGRDEGRLISAVQRIQPGARDDAEIEGRLKADVAIQRMGAQRERELGAGMTKASSIETRDANAVRGDVLGVVNEKSRFTAGALAAGRFESAHPDMRKWIQDSVSFAGRQAAVEADRSHAAGANMARIGAFASSSRPVVPAGVATGAKGPSTGPSLAEQSLGRDGGRGR